MNDLAGTTFASEHTSRQIELLLVSFSMALTLAAYFSLIALALLAGAAVLLLASMRYRPLLLGMIFLMPVNPYLSWHLPVKDLQTLLRFCLFAGALLARQRAGEALWPWLFSGRVTRALLGYFAVAVIASTVFNGPTGAAARELMRLTSYLCFYYAIVDWIRTEHDLRAILQALLFSTIVVALFGLYQFAIGGYSGLYEALYPIQDEALKNPPWSGRVTSFLSHYNGAAAYLNMVVPFCIALAVRAQNSFTRRLGRICLVLSTIALVLTQSRGGLLAYVAILLISAYLLAPDQRTRLRWMTAATLFSIAGAVLAGSIFERLSGVDSFTEITRLAIWAGGWLIFIGHPVAGIGYGNFKAALATAISVPDGFMLDAHNLYLELLAETGILGFVLFTMLIIICLRYARRMPRQSADPVECAVGLAVFVAIAGVLVHGFVEYVFHNSPQCAALFFLLIALLGSQQFRSRTVSAGAGMLSPESM
jgi:putative inorganic carbon (hco3(-)) transporter